MLTVQHALEVLLACGDVRERQSVRFPQISDLFPGCGTSYFAGFPTT